ncbi:hypothetical protein DPMN_070352 [Dreissena polymorpha]|uniref:Uncharacterized protein n=1 Tax=Dreissena polymorpha TaxID=45954 RepID=A0A9D3Z2T5_DREPO|nr:hypothetical protein DPMN_070352 [Dreissena polymorpha]
MAHFVPLFINVPLLSPPLQIVWDPVKKRWVDKNGDDKEETPTAPPPKDHELPGTGLIFTCLHKTHHAKMGLIPYAASVAPDRFAYLHSLVWSYAVCI